MPPSSSSVADKALVAVFLTVIALPSLTNLLWPEVRLPQFENRQLTEFPVLSLKAAGLAGFPSRFEAFYNDHFGLRDQFIRWHNILKLRVMHVSPSPRVVLGNDGWLFDYDTVAYACAPPLTQGDLEKWRAAFEERQRFVSAEGATYLLVFAPAPGSIYPEFLPEWARGRVGTTRLDQLLEHLRAQSGISVLDLRDALLDAKDGTRLYHRTDSHWNDHGAYIAYNEIMRSLATKFPGSEPLPASAFQARVVSKPGGDVARMLALPDLVREETLELLPRTPRRARIVEWLPEGAPPPPAAFRMKLEDQSQPRAVVFHDSFTYASLYLFLAEHFSDVWFHWNHYFGPGLKVATRRGEPMWNLSRMHDSEGPSRPAAVIQIVAERALLYEPMFLWAETEEGSD